MSIKRQLNSLHTEAMQLVRCIEQASSNDLPTEASRRRLMMVGAQKADAIAEELRSLVEQTISQERG